VSLSVMAVDGARSLATAPVSNAVEKPVTAKNRSSPGVERSVQMFTRAPHQNPPYRCAFQQQGK